MYPHQMDLVPDMPPSRICYQLYRFRWVNEKNVSLPLSQLPDDPWYCKMEQLPVVPLRCVISLLPITPQPKVLLPDRSTTSCSSTSIRWICFQLYLYQMDPLPGVPQRDGSATSCTPTRRICVPVIPLLDGSSINSTSPRWIRCQIYLYEMDQLPIVFLPDWSATGCTSNRWTCYQ
jgi:hypothetical protein